MARKTKRKGISLALRFSVMRRDFFQCVYCGRKPPAVEVHLDHIVPVANGGETISQNLRTSCHDCNAGKGTAQAESILQQQPVEVFVTDDWPRGVVVAENSRPFPVRGKYHLERVLDSVDRAWWSAWRRQSREFDIEGLCDPEYPEVLESAK